MPAGPHKPFLAVWVLFAAGACLAVLLWRAAGDANLRALAREARREEALGRRGAASQRVLEAKHQAVNELLAGRITLREAAERFGELNALVRDDNDALIGAFPVACGEEALCRNVLSWAEAECRHRPGLAPALARLEEEYRRRFGRDPGPWPALPPGP
jgi:hypothetical protein